MTKLYLKKVSKKEFLGIPIGVFLLVAVVLVIVYWDNIKDLFNKDSFTDEDNSSKNTTKNIIMWTGIVLVVPFILLRAKMAYEG